MSLQPQPNNDNTMITLSSGIFIEVPIWCWYVLKMVDDNNTNCTIMVDKHVIVQTRSPSLTAWRTGLSEGSYKKIPISRKIMVQLFVSRNSFFFARICRCDYNVLWYICVCACVGGTLCSLVVRTAHCNIHTGHRSSITGSLCIRLDGAIIATHHHTHDTRMR